MGHDVWFVTTRLTERGSGTDRTVYLPEAESSAAHQEAVAAALRELRPDVAECSSWDADLLAYARQERGGRAPVVVRGDLSAATTSHAARAEEERALIRLAECTVAVSEYARRDLEAAYGLPVAEVIPNGVGRAMFHPLHDPSVDDLTAGTVLTIDPRANRFLAHPLDGAARERLRRFLGADPRPVVLWVGKATAMKGWDLLQGYMRALRADARFLLLMGHATPHFPLAAFPPEDVFYLQDVPSSEIATVYGLAELVLSTSRWEGFGLSIVEAIACGLPVLVPRSLEVAAEYILPGRTGFPYADVDELRGHLRARPRGEPTLPPEVDWEVNARSTLALYERLLAQKG
jgi:D-inositol-3-phosphate glycosyltransferase